MDDPNATPREMPPGWALAKLDDLGVWSSGGTPSKENHAYWTNGTIPWVSPKDMKSDFVGENVERITEEALSTSAAKKMIPRGSLLCVVRSGILKHTFPVSIAECDVTINQDLRALTLHQGIEPRYLQFYLHSRNQKILNECAKDGTTVSSIDAGRLGRLACPVPPLPEQRRIAAKIDELFGEIEAGEQELEKAREGLATYRRAVLKAAITGELTRDWREKNEPNKTAREFLARISANRDEDGKRRKQAVKIGGDYEMPDLPKDWIWVSLDELTSESSYGTSAKCSFDAAGVPVLRIPNIRNGRVTEENLKYATVDLGIDNSDMLRPGDFLIIRTNGSESLIGRGGVVLTELTQPSYFASYLIRFRLLGGDLIGRWVAWVWDSDWIRECVRKSAATSAGQYNISQSKLAAFPVPLPSEAELVELLHRIDVIESARHDLSGSLDDRGEATALRQSVLSAAFSGRLVPQDVRDEPASDLLKRLRADKAAATQVGGKLRSQTGKRIVKAIVRSQSNKPAEGAR